MLLANIANVLADLNETEESDKFYGESLGIARYISDNHAEATTLLNWGIAKADHQELEFAESRLRNARELFREVGDSHSEGIVLLNLGKIRNLQGNAHEAVTLLHEASERVDHESPAYDEIQELLVSD